MVKIPKTNLLASIVSMLLVSAPAMASEADLFVPEILQPLLIRTGFEKIYSGYILDLNMAW